ncbi:hypothetical protein MNBD_ALPHA09-168 [hydrothermal vent metagenome]|uniref:Uncharacterized protein n=1 Tax=hydrothermal vent metagenome TaxID=652676 RepID=A0A3B0T7W1_9ZZZZ
MRITALTISWLFALTLTALSAGDRTIFDDGRECMDSDKLLIVPFEIARTYSAQCKQIKVDEYGQSYLNRARERPSLNAAEARLIARIAFYGRPEMAKEACHILGLKGEQAKIFKEQLKRDTICD